MKALILNGAKEGHSSIGRLQTILVRALERTGWQAEPVLLYEKRIANCKGCFGCWVRTPGECVIDDFGRDIARMMIGSDLVVYLTPVTFGGYSARLKKAVDRTIPLVLPFFTQIDGEIHHKPRYESYPRLVSLGLMRAPDDESERIFGELLARNALNFHTNAYASAVFFEAELTGEDNMENVVNRIQETLAGVVVDQ